jgi:plasmid stability protein
MSVDLFIKNVPQVVKELISREAVDHRRSINQEAIALLEEALAFRTRSPEVRRSELNQLLEALAGLPHPAAGRGASMPMSAMK